MVVMSDESDEDEEDEDDAHHALGTVYREAPVYRGGDDEDDEDSDDEKAPPVYRNLSSASYTTCASQTMSPRTMAAIDGMAVSAPAKRGRSFGSEAAALPPPPTKQRSQPSSRRTTSPPPNEQADLIRIEFLKAKIAAEKAELSNLMQAYRENEEALRQIRLINATLLADLRRADRKSVV